ncbi:MAG: heme lyase NrfEFG subunit NrfE [Hyphomicrobiales bacterium]|nr:MAG: heme lyase NrfEFG subunit NrfE [Hyphomicrobiales bacterium]
MIVELGHFALCVALVVALLQAVVPLAGAHRGTVGAMQFADSAAQIQFLAVTGAFAALVYAYVVSDFSVANVALNSHSTKPMLYKVTGVWANHEGSMLLWVFMLALFGVLISLFGGNIPLSMRARVLAIQALIGFGFLAFILATSNPFERLPAPPVDGRGMNPLLQDPGVAFHPPFLYLGYVGFSTAFSFAVGALIAGRIDPSWARWMRPWILIAWSGLTLGIALGSWWAYYELGWGGFWFWDPVENASFMPWLLGTALLHSAIVVEKRDALQKWTILLAILTFGLSLIGTFLVRSGILSSVHAFAQDPERGVFILGLLIIAIGGALALFAARASTINGGGLFTPFSREGSLLLNNLLLAAGGGAVFVGTLYPLFVDIFTGEKLTVGAPYFNLTFIPMFAPVALVAAIGPMLSWKRADARALVQRLYVLLAAAIGACVLTGIFASRADILGYAGMAVAAWLIAGTLSDFVDRAGFARVGFLGGLRRAFGLPRSSYGLYLGHGGLALAILGVTAISVWQAEGIQVQKPGDVAEVGGYGFTLVEVNKGEGPNYQAEIATITVKRGDEAVGTMYPERRWYPVEGKATTEAAIDTRWHGDLYAVIGDPDGKGGWVTRFYYNPGVVWMWVGGVLMAFAGMVSLADRRLRIGAPARRANRATRSKAGRKAAPAAILALGLLAAMGGDRAAALTADELLPDPAMEAKAREIGKELRCLVCQNESIFDSNASLARDLRILVRERLQAGDDAAAVKGYVVDRYGDFVLLKPPVKPTTYVLWAAPVLFIAIAFLIGGAYYRRSGKDVAGRAALSAEDRDAARKILEGGAQ